MTVAIQIHDGSSRRETLKIEACEVAGIEHPSIPFPGRPLGAAALFPDRGMATSAVHPFEAPIIVSTVDPLRADEHAGRQLHGVPSEASSTSMAVNGADRRRAWRHPAHLGVSLDSGTGVSRDVSASGIYFETDAALSPGETIAFSFNLEHIYPDVRFALHCTGKIVRVEQRDGPLGVAATIEAWSFEPPSKAGGEPETSAAVDECGRDGLHFRVGAHRTA